jgi:GT2 family glycosyltransferase
VIVTWNAKDYLVECLESLEKAENLTTEIIVVDNASTDGTAEAVRHGFPDVTLLETGENLGFSRGNNSGMKLAKGKYVCLINPDVNVLSGCLSNMYRFMEMNRDIGLLGPAMLGRNGRVLRSGMRFPTLWNTLLRSLAADSFLKQRLNGTWLMHDFAFNELRDMEVLNGWFWMARREAVRDVGPLDASFFMYGEDMDWCTRLRAAGWRVVFYPEAAAVHYGGGSSSNDPLRFSLEKERAQLQYWQKYHGRTSFMLFVTALCLGHALRVLGWGLIWLTWQSRRTRAVFEVEQNFACLRQTMSFWGGGQPGKLRRTGAPDTLSP